MDVGAVGPTTRLATSFARASVHERTVVAPESLGLGETFNGNSIPSLDGCSLMSFADAILLIEPDPSVGAALVDALRGAAHLVRHEGTAAGGIRAARHEQPELIVLDVGLHGTVDVVALCRVLREVTNVPIIVAGVRRSEQDVVQVLNAGADDVLARPFGMVELVARVRAQLRRAILSQGVAPNVLYVGDLTLDLGRRIVTRDGRDVGLTPVEWQLFRLLATNAGRTLTHQQLFRAIWGNVFGDAQQTLRVHITHLRRKVEPRRGARTVIVTEPGVGYRCERPDVAWPRQG
jgi:two-component system KDP operon response regulator KdpE